MIRLTREQVREIDRRAIEEYQVPSIVLMENAARNAADVATEMLGRTARASVLILCGGGNNGGDGLAVARHLHNRGAYVEIGMLAAPDKLSDDARVNFNIVSRMPIAIIDLSKVIDGLEPNFSWTRDLVIDAIFGTGLTRAPRPPFDRIVERLERAAAPVLAIDVPSGLDSNTGEPLGPCVRAKRTITFVAEKAGFANPASKQYTGEIAIGDIGCPRELIDEVAKMSPS